MHDLAVGHDTPLREGPREAGTSWPDQVLPPFFVATITVEGTGVAFRPAEPTAQHRVAVAHDTAWSTPVPSGAA
jgi:hypothetical protein